MKKTRSAVADLAAENTALRARLEEAEQTLEAIRLGQVDALIVEGEAGDRVFTLQGADHRYRRIVEGMTEGAAIVDPRGVVLYANLAFARLVTMPLDRALGSRLSDYVPAEATATFERLLREASDSVAINETTFIRGAGRVIPVHVSAVTEPDQGGICLIVTDLSEAMREGAQRQAELSAALDSKSRLLEVVLLNMPSALVAVDLEGVFTVVNRRAEELWGRAVLPASPAPVSRPVLRVAVADTKWSEYRFFAGGAELERGKWPIPANLDRGEETRNREIEMRRPDGVTLTLRLSAAPLRGTSGEIVGAAAVFDDISAERRLEEERKHALDALDLLVETSAALASSIDYEETLVRVAELAVPRLGDMCSVYMKEADGSVSRVASSHKDQEKAEILRALHRTRLFEDDAPFGYPEVLRSGRSELFEHAPPEMLRSHVRDEAELALLHRLDVRSWIGVPLTRQGRTVGALFFSRTAARPPFSRSDVPLAEEIGKRASLAIENARLYRDAKATVEAERRARDKAEEATRLKDEFLATLSHELRTPLNAILGWSRMLQSGATPEDKRAHAVDTIVRNAFAQNQLIEDLLDVSRIISGKLRLNVDMVDVARVVEAAIDVVQPAADARGVRIQRLLDPDAGFVPGDAGRLQQVVWNLLSNAVKFTPREGRVHITLRRTDSNVELSIADTGAGISAEFLPYVFDRFRQEDGAITRKTGGLGLGLAIVKSIVELHGGTIEARSDGERSGSSFIVRIPVAPVRATPVARAVSPRILTPPPPAGAEVTCPPEIAGLNVLVIDDEADARDLLRAVLESCHAVVTTAASAEDGLALVESTKPDVILSDIGMPEEDGYSFIRRLRGRPRDGGGRTPAVALTAYARPEDRRRALLEGFQNHASKPVDPQELVIVLANVVGRTV